MINEYFQYLDRHFVKKEIMNQTHYCFKDVPNSLKVLHIKMKQQKDIKWKPETLSVLSYSRGFTDSEIEEKKKNLQVLKNVKKKEPFVIEKIPEWFIEFSKQVTYLNIFRGTIILSSDLINNALCVKPKTMKGLYYIGQYAGTTPQSCPIFTNEKGEIFVFEAKDFRDYPQNEHDVKKYLKSKPQLIRKWPQIDYFLIEETERFRDIFVRYPTIHAIKNPEPKR